MGSPEAWDKLSSPLSSTFRQKPPQDTPKCSSGSGAASPPLPRGIGLVPTAGCWHLKPHLGVGTGGSGRSEPHPAGKSTPTSSTAGQRLLCSWEWAGGRDLSPLSGLALLRTGVIRNNETKLVTQLSSLLPKDFQAQPRGKQASFSKTEGEQTSVLP